METQKAPAHDFAPSWLKIPSPSFQKSSATGDDNLEQQLSLRPQYLNKDYRGLTSTGPTNSSGNNKLLTNGYEPTGLQHKKEKPHHKQSSFLSSRNHSVEGDEVDAVKTPAAGNSGNLNRRSYTRVKPEQHPRRPHSRHDFRDTFYPKTGHGYGGDNNKSVDSVSEQPSAEDISTESSNRKSNSKGPIDSNTFNKEFPSLVDVNSVSASTNGNNSNNVWDNANAKHRVLTLSSSKNVTLIQRHVGPEDGHKSPEAVNGIMAPPAYYRAFVSKKKLSVGGLINGHHPKVLPVFTKSTNQTTPAMEILVKNPRMRSNKNEFLKTLRSADNAKEDPVEEEVESEGSSLSPGLTNGVSMMGERKGREQSLILSPTKSGGNGLISKAGVSSGLVPPLSRFSQSRNGGLGLGLSLEAMLTNEDEELGSPSSPGSSCLQLSSSLEAEQRLLREMGWKENEGDEDVYAPLTEDEVKEFKDLITARHGFKRHVNLNHPHFQLNWSPKKSLPVNSAASPCEGDVEGQEEAEREEEDTSSSSDDEDDKM